MRSIPQHVSIVTLGTRDLTTIRNFYARWGWKETAGSEATWCAFDVGGMLLSFYSMDELAREAAATPRTQSEWGGFTLALNLASEAELARVFELAIEAGAEVVADLQQREWGGISGYVADPDGNRWELATGGPNPAPKTTAT